ncbi:MAG TPA: hypothetical protein VGD66_07725 [Allosphingosinicella sp.]|jgi:hypothetical protein
MARLLALPLLLLPAACLVRIPVADPVYSPCHAVSSTGWSAHVERFPTAHVRPILKPMLVVAGKVTVPGEGYAVSLDLGPVEKLREPVQEIMVRTTPPGGDATGGPATYDVRGTFPARKRYGAVRLRCGDGTLAIIRDVPRED